MYRLSEVSYRRRFPYFFTRVIATGSVASPRMLLCNKSSLDISTGRAKWKRCGACCITASRRRRTMDRDEKMPVRTTALCAAVQAVGGGLGWSVLPPLMPVIAKELGISHAMGGVVWGAASLGIALASPLGGAAVDRYGPRRVAGVAMAVGAMACAARAWVSSPWTLALTMLLFGAHIGFSAPAIPKALAAHVAPARLARAN